MRLTVPDYANDNMSRSSTPGSIYSTTSDSTAVSQSSYTNPLLINPMDVQAMQGVPQMTSGGSSGQGTIQPQKLMIHPSLLNAAPAPAPNEVAQAPKEAHHPSQIQQPMIVPVRNGSGPGVYLQVPVNNLTQGTDTVMATHAIVGADGRTSYVQLPLAMPGPVAPPPPPAMRYTPSNPNLKLDGAPRIRVQQACEKCRRRKVKCSGDRPTCVRCTKKGVYCEWAPERSMKGPDRGRMMQRSQTSLHYAPAEPDYTTYQDLPYLGATYSCPGSVAMSATNSQEGNTAVQYVVMHQNSVPQSMTTYTSGPQSQPSTPQRSVPRRGHSVIDLLNPMPLPPRMAMIMNDPNEGYFPSPTYMQTTNSFLGGPNDHHNNRSPAAMPLHVGGQSGYITTPPGMSTIPVIVLPGGSQYPTPVHTPPTWSAEPPAISPPASRVSSSTTDLTTSSTTLLPSGNGNGNGSELDVSESRSSIGSHFGVGHSGPELDYVMDTGMCEREGKKNGWDEESEGSFRTVSDPSGFQCESETHQSLSPLNLSFVSAESTSSLGPFDMPDGTTPGSLVPSESLLAYEAYLEKVLLENQSQSSDDEQGQEQRHGEVQAQEQAQVPLIDRLDSPDIPLSTTSSAWSMRSQASKSGSASKKNFWNRKSKIQRKRKISNNGKGKAKEKEAEKKQPKAIPPPVIASAGSFYLENLLGGYLSSSSSSVYSNADVSDSDLDVAQVQTDVTDNDVDCAGATKTLTRRNSLFSPDPNPDLTPNKDSEDTSITTPPPPVSRTTSTDSNSNSDADADSAPLLSTHEDSTIPSSTESSEVTTPVDEHVPLLSLAGGPSREDCRWVDSSLSLSLSLSASGSGVGLGSMDDLSEYETGTGTGKAAAAGIESFLESLAMSTPPRKMPLKNAASSGTGAGTGMGMGTGTGTGMEMGIRFDSFGDINECGGLGKYAREDMDVDEGARLLDSF